MNPSEIAMLALGSGVAAFGWMIRSAVASVNARLERLESKLNEIVTQVNVSVARQDVNTVEIDKLRGKVHEMESELVAVSAIQARCPSCTPRK
jgi:chromosome segregation ATPase